MKRTTKNIIVAIIIVLSICSIGFTIYLGNKSLNKTDNTNNTMQNGNVDRPMGGPQGGMDGERPEMPDGEMPDGGMPGDGNEPPEMPDGEAPTERGGDRNLPENTKNQKEDSDSSEKETKKNKKSSSDTDAKDKSKMGGAPGGMPNDMQGGNPPEMPNGNSTGVEVKSTLSTTYYVAFALESIVLSSSIMYLILSKGNQKTFKETFEDKDKIIICALAVVLMTTASTFACGQITTSINKNDSTQEQMQEPFTNEQSNIEYSSSNEIKEDKEITTGSYESSKSDENALSIDGDIDVTLSDITVTKTGDSDSGDATSFYGTNSAIIAKNGANLEIKNATITTDANGANGVFSYGGSATTNNSSSDGTTITISDSKIRTKQNNSGGIMTTGGGTTIAKNLTIETDGISSAAIRSDRGGGTVTVDGGTYKTNGQGSPAIYSTADITVSNATLEATTSEGVVIEGKNSVTLNNTKVTATNTKLNGKSNTYKTIFIYQSMSGDASVGAATFTATDSTITNNKGDIFYITNTKATINLTNTKLVNKDSDGNFLKIAAGPWGSEGKNGGEVTLNADSETIKGNILVDNISTLTFNLTNSSYTGTINGENTAKSITLKLDKSSKIKLTGDTYVTSLEDEDTKYNNIDFNGYKLYVNGVSIN